MAIGAGTCINLCVIYCRPKNPLHLLYYKTESVEMQCPRVFHYNYHNKSHHSVENVTSEAHTVDFLESINRSSVDSVISYTSYPDISKTKQQTNEKRT